MKIAAVIAEYNPFHNGHFYHLKTTRRETGADYILAVMSGNFVQRGAPAIMNKYIRTKAALLNGADAVIELPALYALSSAEFFAGGAVSLLNSLNVVDFLSFGSESGDLAGLEDCARILVENESKLHSATKIRLKNGDSYPSARASALSDISPRLAADLPDSPNNILGLEYCKNLFATQSKIRPFTIKRTDKGYHCTALNAAGGFNGPALASASAIRKAVAHSAESVFPYVPENTRPFFAGGLTPVTENFFSHTLHYKLLTESSLGFSEYLDCTPDLSDKIRKNLPLYTGFSDFCRMLKSKELTYTRISRVLMHILLNIKTPDFYRPVLAKRKLYTPYARLLGFRAGSEPLLSEVKKNSSVPLLSKLADARFFLDDKALSLLTQDVYCADVYESAVTYATGRPAPNEWKTSPIIE